MVSVLTLAIQEVKIQLKYKFHFIKCGRAKGTFVKVLLKRFYQPRSQDSLLPIPTEQERDPGWVWSCVSRTKLIQREEFFVSQFFCLDG